MEILFKVVFIFTMTLLVGCQTTQRSIAADEHQHVGALPTGGRKGLHGMVLFGDKTYFIEHIPMLTPPHDFQILATVVLKDKKGQNLVQDFSKIGYTLKPESNFSLNDFVAGRLTRFNAGVYRGSFEQDGQLLTGLENVQVEILEMNLTRALPSESSESFFEVSDGKNTFQTTLITPKNNIQKIVNKDVKTPLWCVTGPDFFEPCK